MVQNTGTLLSHYNPLGRKMKSHHLCTGFMRVPNNEAQCEQAGGICSKDHCFHLHTRAFGHCQRGVPCCRTVVSYSCTRNSCLLGNGFVIYLSKYTQRVSYRSQRFPRVFITTQNNGGKKSNERTSMKMCTLLPLCVEFSVSFSDM